MNAKTQAINEGLGRKVVKSMASISRSVVTSSLEYRCFVFMHEPEEPKDLAKRVQVMNGK